MFFQGQTLYWTYLRNGWSDWCKTKRRCIGWMLENYVTMTFDLTHDLDLWFFKVKFQNSLKVKVWNSLIWGMGVEALIDMERKGCKLIIHDHDCDLWVTMVGWATVPYSDGGDFRRRRAIDISSSSWIMVKLGRVLSWVKMSAEFFHGRRSSMNERLTS